MATPDQVGPIYYAQLNNDAREQTLAEGGDWETASSFSNRRQVLTQQNYQLTSTFEKETNYA